MPNQLSKAKSKITVSKNGKELLNHALVYASSLSVFSCKHFNGVMIRPFGNSVRDAKRTYDVFRFPPWKQ